MPRKNIFIAAGEPSGDKLGASLIYALKERAPEAYTFWGIGGEAIRAEGLTSLFPLEDIAVMGLTEVIPRLPQIMKHLQTTKRALRAHPPDILLTIDAPEFMYRLHKTSRRLGIPTLHWGAPSVWAWRPGRARKLATRIDHLLALFPFEPPFFEKHGLKTTYVGHPMANDPELQPQVAEKLDDFRAHYRIDAERPLLCVLPGSRKSEIERHFPIFEQTVRLLHTEMPGMQVILPTLPHWKAHLQEKTHYWPYPPIITTSSAEKGLAFYAASAALAVSGTVTLELACARTPTVVTYRTDSVSAFLIRPLLRTPFIALPNIVMQKSVMPEFLQEKCTPILLANAIREILLPKRQEEIKRMLGEVREKIHSQGITAADIVERYLGF